MQRSDGQNYAPQGKPQPVVEPGAFRFAAIGLDHGHIYGQCNGLIEAGGTLVAVHDPDPAKVERFVKTYPQARAVADRRAILEDPAIHLVASACVPSQRGPLACLAMRHGKDAFVDKAPFTTAAQLAEARRTVAETGRIFAVYYSERLHVECAVAAGELVAQGAIGRVVQVIGMGPHRHGPPGARPDWFYRRADYGGILIDIGSHQLEQFLFFTGNASATVQAAKVANYRFPQFPEFEDFGDVTVIGANGATGYHRVDWLNPDGLGTWGDGRLFLLGTEGYIELRKYIDVAQSRDQDTLIIVDHRGERRIACNGRYGFPYFGRLIRDCLDRTETAMPQAHTFAAAELCLQAQAAAQRVA
jgi:predicted dehydrogenase